MSNEILENVSAEIIRESEEKVYIDLGFTRVYRDTGDRVRIKFPRIDISSVRADFIESDYHSTELINEPCGGNVIFELAKDDEDKFFSVEVNRKPIEVTMDEVEAKFGRPIKIIK